MYESANGRFSKIPLLDVRYRRFTEWIVFQEECEFRRECYHYQITQLSLSDGRHENEISTENFYLRPFAFVICMSCTPGRFAGTKTGGNQQDA